jgi:predicted DNA-binding transcriptional regulator AlpA
LARTVFQEIPYINNMESSSNTEVATDKLVLTTSEAAAIFQKSVRTWRSWDAAGKIPKPMRIGRATYWRPEELRAWVAAGCPDRETWEAMRE